MVAFTNSPIGVLGKIVSFKNLNLVYHVRGIQLRTFQRLLLRVVVFRFLFGCCCTKFRSNRCT